MSARFITGTESHFTLPAGRYWIGDLCYVMDDPFRDKHLDLIIGETARQNGVPFGGILNGKFEVNGITYGEFSTEYGDGGYAYDVDHMFGAKVIDGANDVSVDSGTIGIIPFEAIKDLAEAKRLGIVVEFTSEFECYSETRRNAKDRNSAGDLHFGGVTVHTGDWGCEEDEDEYEDESD